jgi:hypothetical protein
MPGALLSRLGLISLAVALAALAAAPAALAHKGGKAEPQISAKAAGNGYDRTVVVRLKDVDGGGPIRGAEVSISGQMVRPHLMTLIPRSLSEVSAGTYRGRYPFIMRGDWKVNIEVTGKKVTRASAELPVAIGGSSASGVAGASNVLPTRLETAITGRDYLTMLVLWLHGLAAMGWIIGVIAMSIALSTEQLLVSGVRAKISAAYRRWGAWVHWASVPVIVATGIYNMIYVTPFTLRWPLSSALDTVAYGRTYEAILVVKLGLFVVLFATGTLMLARIVRSPTHAAAPSAAPAGSAASTTGPIKTLVAALGPPGILYVSTVPLILAAAMALRYVHILSHVAEVVNSR